MEQTCAVQSRMTNWEEGGRSGEGWGWMKKAVITTTTQWYIIVQHSTSYTVVHSTKLESYWFNKDDETLISSPNSIPLQIIRTFSNDHLPLHTLHWFGREIRWFVHSIWRRYYSRGEIIDCSHVGYRNKPPNWKFIISFYIKLKISNPTLRNLESLL